MSESVRQKSNSPTRGRKKKAKIFEARIAPTETEEILEMVMRDKKAIEDGHVQSF